MKHHQDSKAAAAKKLEKTILQVMKKIRIQINQQSIQWIEK